MAVGTIILGYLISDNAYGLYAIAFILPNTVLIFQDWGVGQAMLRNCAKCRAENKLGEARKIIVAGLTFEIITGSMLTLVSLGIANFIATDVYQKPESGPLIILASLTVISTALFTANLNIFTGFEKLKLSRNTMIFQAIIQTAICPLLVYLGYGATGAVIGYVSAAAAAAVISTIFLYFSIFKKLPKTPKDGQSMFQLLKPLLGFGVPLAISSGIALILTQFTSFMMAIYVIDNAVIGNYRIAMNFAILIAFVTVPISTVLFPAFSKLDPKNEKDLLKTVFSSSIKYTSLFLLPTTMAVIVLATPLIGSFYGNKWSFASPFLALYVLSNLEVLLGSLSVWSFFTAMGKTKFLMKVNLFTLSIGIPIAVLLIPKFGINGLIIGTIFTGLPSLFILLYFAWRQYDAQVDYKSSAKIFLSSGFAAFVTYLFLTFSNLPNWAHLIVQASSFLLGYIQFSCFDRSSQSA